MSDSSIPPLSGKWTGAFNQIRQSDAEIRTVIGKFELDITESDGSFEGTCTDEALKDLLHEPITIRGFIEENMISFIKTYPVKYIWDKTGNSYLIDKSPGHEVEYNGEYDSSTGNFKGTWQIEQEDPNDPYGAPLYLFGKWLMHRGDEMPDDLEAIQGQFFEYWQEKIFPFFNISMSDTEVFTPWLGELEVHYVIKLDDHFNYLIRTDLKPGTSMEDVHQLALNNLTSQVMYTPEPISDGFFNISTEGLFEAELILHPYLWDELSEKLNSDLIVAIPAKDTILLAVATDLLAVSNLKAAAEEQFRSSRRNLSDRYFLFNKATKEWKIE